MKWVFNAADNYVLDIHNKASGHPTKEFTFTYIQNYGVYLHLGQHLQTDQFNKEKKMQTNTNWLLK